VTEFLVMLADRWFICEWRLTNREVRRH